MLFEVAPKSKAAEALDRCLAQSVPAPEKPAKAVEVLDVRFFDKLAELRKK